LKGITEWDRVVHGIGLASPDEKDRQERPREVSAAIGRGPLQVVAPGSSLELSRAALDTVADFAMSLQAGATLVAVQVVPYTLPLDSPPVSSQFYCRRLEEIVSRSPVPVRTELLLARDQEFALQRFLPPASVILVAARRRRWGRKSAEEKLACALRRAGHRVALVMI
jgi:hypothetical protein